MWMNSNLSTYSWVGVMSKYVRELIKPLTKKNNTGVAPSSFSDKRDCLLLGNPQRHSYQLYVNDPAGVGNYECSLASLAFLYKKLTLVGSTIPNARWSSLTNSYWIEVTLNSSISLLYNCNYQNCFDMLQRWILTISQ